MHIVHPEVERYLAEVFHHSDPTLLAMEALAHEKDFPIIGPQVGQLLALLARSKNARTVFEMGSGYGYSAIWFAGALPAGGMVHCTDGSEKNREKAMAYFEQAGVRDKTTFRVGNALELIDEAEGPFDIIFNDIDKQDYPAALELAVPKLAPGGLFITDNALWYGKVAETEPTDDATAGVLEFNRKSFADDRIDSVILPLRDGLMISQRR